MLSLVWRLLLQLCICNNIPKQVVYYPLELVNGCIPTEASPLS